MRVLSITNQLPMPMRGGASVYTYNLLSRVAVEHDVWHVAFATTPEQIAGAHQMRSFCQGVITVPLANSKALNRPLDLVRYLVAGKPIESRFFYSRELAYHLEQLLQEVNFDIIQIEQGDMGQYLDLLPNEMWPRAIWILHDIDWIKYSRIAEMETRLARKFRLRLHGMMMRRWVPNYAAHFGCCTTISERDRDRLLEANPKLNVKTIPAGVDTGLLQPLPYQDGTRACVFVGNMDYLPNCDAVLYFCHDILPRIWQVMPDVEMWIVGATPRPEVKMLASERIHVTGTVEEVQPYYGQSTVCVLPLRAGSGARLKILEAMALGRPVVSTSIGCEGQELVDGRHVMIADTSEAFASRTIELLSDVALRGQIARQARDLVVETYDWSVITRQLTDIYWQLAQR